MQSQFYRRSFLVVAAALLAYGLYRVLAPLRAELGWAAVLAFVLYPLHQWLTARLKGRPALSAGILTGLTPFLVLAPLAMLGVAFAGQVAHLVAHLKGSSVLSWSEVLTRLSTLPVIGGWVSWARDNAVVSASEIEGWISGGVESLLKSAAATGGDLALGVFGTLIGFFMMLFMLFFFLQDGRAMLAACERLIPMAPEQRTRFLNYLGDVTRAVVFGSVATALFNGVVVGIGFAIVGLPSPLVFGVLAVLAAFLPSGSAIVLIPAALYLAFSGRWGAALFLALWTVGLWVAESVLRPLLASRHADVSPLAVFIGAIGGVSAFGILGLIVGPVLLSFVVAVVRFAEESLAARA
ncbi:MAG TPA: AI-2E family transporter [Steroidobacteraceae bacterium]|nr:AI-2E family transporter [Steroidobacteraceae bacterium]